MFFLLGLDFVVVLLHVHASMRAYRFLYYLDDLLQAVAVVYSYR